MIQRARLFFFVALAVAVVILVANLPVGALVNGRAAVRSDAAELASLQAENRLLAAQVKALHDPAVVGRIAHSDYGLTGPGERSVVVLPGAAKVPSSGENPLADNRLPSSDLLPSDAILDPASAAAALPPVHEPGFWHRVVSSLEFWHSLF
jgi:cell division protein FtsB